MKGLFFFFFNDTATTEIYTLSLHDALPILYAVKAAGQGTAVSITVLVALLVCLIPTTIGGLLSAIGIAGRSEEHTSELQSRLHLVCRLLLEKKNKTSSPTGFLTRHATPDST